MGLFSSLISALQADLGYVKSVSSFCSASNDSVLLTAQERSRSVLDHQGGFPLFTPTVVLSWRAEDGSWWSYTEDVPLCHLGSKVAATVRADLSLDFLQAGLGGRSEGVSTFGNHLLELYEPDGGADEGFMLLSPVALPRVQPVS